MTKILNLKFYHAIEELRIDNQKKKEKSTEPDLQYLIHKNA